MRTSTLLLVGPNKLSRVGLRSLFQESPFTVIGEVSDVSAIDPGAGHAPDIVLAELPGDSAAVLAALARLDALFPDTPVVVLSATVRMETLCACLAAGAGGFLTTDISRDALFRSLQLARLGETVFPTDLAAMLVHGVRESRRPLRGNSNGGAPDACGLSEREVDIVQCLLRGDSNKLIAARLRVTEATIKVHIKSVLRKIKASNRTQAAIWAYSNGYLPLGDAAPRADGRAGPA